MILRLYYIGFKGLVLSSTIILNFLPIKSGGGLQNALGFLKNMESEKVVVVCNKNSLVEELSVEMGLSILTVKDSLLSRTVFELIGFRKHFVKHQKCFTLFGPAWLGAFGYLHNISGFAYSNLLYPEIKFWGYLGFFEKVIKEVKDKFRYKAILMSDEIVFETEELFNRAYKSKEFRNKKIHLVKMALSDFLRNDSSVCKDENTKDIINVKTLDALRLIYVGGSHPNKRIHLIIEMVEKLKMRGVRVNLDLTIHENENKYSRNVAEIIKDKTLLNEVRFIGRIPYNEVLVEIRKYDAVVNLSLLESFSNNFIEAWGAQRLLVVTDADWSRASCKDAACYIDVEEMDSSVDNIVRVFSDFEAKKQLIKNGLRVLKSHPSPREKNKQYLSIIRGL